MRISFLQRWLLHSIPWLFDIFFIFEPHQLQYRRFGGIRYRSGKCFLLLQIFPSIHKTLLYVESLSITQETILRLMLLIFVNRTTACTFIVKHSVFVAIWTFSALPPLSTVRACYHFVITLCTFSPRRRLKESPLPTFGTLFASHYLLPPVKYIRVCVCMYIYFISK